MFKIEDYKLTIEQEFQLKQIENIAKISSKEQLIEAYLKACTLIMIKDNLLKRAIKHNG